MLHDRKTTRSSGHLPPVFTCIQAMVGFSLQPITYDDVATLAEIGHEAFLADTHTQMKAQGKGDPRAHAKDSGEHIRQWIEMSDGLTTLKATEDATGEIMGFICWGFRNYSNPEPTKLSLDSLAKENRIAVQVLSDKEQDIADPIDCLQAITGNDMQRWQAKIEPHGTKCMYVMGISVRPKFQSRGVGSALIGWGTKKADEDGVFCWVHASDGGHRAFAKAGFQVIDSLEIDLDAFAVGRRENGDKWGTYTLRMMVRLPQRVT